MGLSAAARSVAQSFDRQAREFETAAMPLGPEQRDPLELSQLSGDPRVMKEPDPRQLRA
jgi:hypothetical protein